MKIEFAATVTTTEDVSFNTVILAHNKQEAEALLLSRGFAFVFIW